MPDIAVNPASGNVYLAVARGAGADAEHLILKADRSGAITELDLDATPHTSVALVDQPDADKVDRRGNALRTDTITDLGYVDGKVVVAGLSNEEFASTLRAIPYPFTAVDQGRGDRDLARRARPVRDQRADPHLHSPTSSTASRRSWPPTPARRWCGSRSTS